ncbi:hypothetical protein CHARACLAT_012385 [Characodon lateralis]|uniref:Uncharacterized protein n=1 Tax=Characodon lateralis TaxID=208331 RepID=A0ABU7ETC1_9TELE|nr:hypothetical protein [Characodon lateralis]
MREGARSRSQAEKEKHIYRGEVFSLAAPLLLYQAVYKPPINTKLNKCRKMTSGTFIATITSQNIALCNTSVFFAKGKPSRKTLLWLRMWGAFTQDWDWRKHKQHSEDIE